MATLRLKLTDDKILDSTVGKTPVMVLQEHATSTRGARRRTRTLQRRHRGREPAVHVGPVGSAVVYRQGDGLGGIEGTGVDTTKKRAKQRGALEVLRQLYQHVELWGDLVESMNSRQRILRAAGEAKRQWLCGPQAGASAARRRPFKRTRRRRSACWKSSVSSSGLALPRKSRRSSTCCRGNGAWRVPRLSRPAMMNKSKTFRGIVVAAPAA